MTTRQASRKGRIGFRMAGVALGALALSFPARAFIDPNFTPVDLVHAADAIALATPTREEGGAGLWKLAPAVRLKGEIPDAVQLSLAEMEADAEIVAQALAEAGQTGAMVFMGEFEGERSIHLHIGEKWLLVDPAEDDRWLVRGINPRMKGTFDGSTTSLFRMSDYLLNHDTGDVPVTVGMNWFSRAVAGAVSPPVWEMHIIQPFGGLDRPHIHIAGTGGDALLRPTGDDAFTDVTQAVGLSATSRHAAWLRRSEGTPISLFSHHEGKIGVWDAVDGKLQAAGDVPFDGVCIGLSPLRIGNQPALLISTPTAPLVARLVDGAWQTASLPVDDALLTASGAGATALAADFDGSGYVDVLQPRERQGLLWRGTADGFAQAIAVPPTHAGSQNPTLALGDLNLDGLLDVFISGPFESELWEQDTSGSFSRVLRHSGSLAIKAPPAATGALTTDLNHDGRTDIAIFYETRTALYHFNRGYRVMGEEGELPMDQGGVAAVAADMNEDTSLDLLVARRDGTLLFSANELFDVPSLSIRLGDKVVGPVTVSVWQGTDEHPYCVGTVSVDNHKPSIVALRRTGAAELRWRLAGREQTKARVNVGNTSQPFTIE